MNSSDKEMIDEALSVIRHAKQFEAFLDLVTKPLKDRALLHRLNNQIRTSTVQRVCPREIRRIL